MDWKKITGRMIYLYAVNIFLPISIANGRENQLNYRQKILKILHLKCGQRFKVENIHQRRWVLHINMVCSFST